LAAWIGAPIHTYEYTKTGVTRPDYYEPLRKGGGLGDAPGRWLVGAKAEYALRAPFPD